MRHLRRDDGLLVSPKEAGVTPSVALASAAAEIGAAWASCERERSGGSVFRLSNSDFGGRLGTEEERRRLGAACALSVSRWLDGEDGGVAAAGFTVAAGEAGGGKGWQPEPGAGRMLSLAVMLSGALRLNLQIGMGAGKRRRRPGLLVRRLLGAEVEESEGLKDLAGAWASSSARRGRATSLLSISPALGASSHERLEFLSWAEGFGAGAAARRLLDAGRSPG